MNPDLRNILLICTVIMMIMGCSGNDSSISGKIRFSYFGLPKMEMNIYAKNIRTGEVYHDRTTSKQNTFKIKGIPPGKYIVYAYSKEAEIGEYVLPEKIKLFGGYSKAALCERTDICEDHKLIKIEIKENQHLTDILIGDWFTAEVPDE